MLWDVRHKFQRGDTLIVDFVCLETFGDDKSTFYGKALSIWETRGCQRESACLECLSISQCA
jgi:hypothetical protein